MIHRTTRRFWDCYWALPEQIRELADKSFNLLRKDPRHPSLHFKKIGQIWSARVDSAHRALAVLDGQDYIWVWIGTHDDYVRLLKDRY
jgi:hypothetical protein